MACLSLMVPVLVIANSVRSTWWRVLEEHVACVGGLYMALPSATACLLSSLSHSFLLSFFSHPLLPLLSPPSPPSPPFPFQGTVCQASPPHPDLAHCPHAPQSEGDVLPSLRPGLWTLLHPSLHWRQAGHQPAGLSVPRTSAAILSQ